MNKKLKDSKIKIISYKEFKVIHDKLLEEVFEEEKKSFLSFFEGVHFNNLVADIPTLARRRLNFMLYNLPKVE